MWPGMNLSSGSTSSFYFSFPEFIILLNFTAFSVSFVLSLRPQLLNSKLQIYVRRFGLTLECCNLLQPCSDELAPRLTDKQACQKKGGTKVPHSKCEFSNSQKEISEFTKNMDSS
jgi:hypothetical protein